MLRLIENLASLRVAQAVNRRSVREEPTWPEHRKYTLPYAENSGGREKNRRICGARCARMLSLDGEGRCPSRSPGYLNQGDDLDALKPVQCYHPTCWYRRDINTGSPLCQVGQPLACRRRTVPYPVLFTAPAVCAGTPCPFGPSRYFITVTFLCWHESMQA